MNALVLVAAGSATRMGGSVPKQFMELGGKPMIVHTLEKFYLFDPGIKVVVVIGADHRKYWESISRGYEWPASIEVAEGGSTRTESVRKGLELIGEGGIVGIHDAVRPLVSKETIERCFNAARESGSGIPVIDMEDSVRMTFGDNSSENLERQRLMRVQTPQAFRSEKILAAYRQLGRTEKDYTDDASVYEKAYGEVTLVQGNIENIKITTSFDLKLAASMLI
jgi:2-C-methyl-D-erythritol 4-phosphate cytidylyltransferase